MAWARAQTQHKARHTVPSGSFIPERTEPPLGESSEHLASTHLCLPVPSAHGPLLSPPLQDLAHSWPWQQTAWPELGRLRDFLVSQDQTHSPIKETAASPEETQLERRSQANCPVGPGPRGSGMGGLVRPLLYHSSLPPHRPRDTGGLGQPISTN